jgi:hypothetical protein
MLRLMAAHRLMLARFTDAKISSIAVTEWAS